LASFGLVRAVVRAAHVGSCALPQAHLRAVEERCPIRPAVRHISALSKPCQSIRLDASRRAHHGPRLERATLDHNGILAAAETSPSVFYIRATPDRGRALLSLRHCTMARGLWFLGKRQREGVILRRHASRTPGCRQKGDGVGDQQTRLAPEVVQTFPRATHNLGRRP